jgi:alpha-ribazole phosphatase
LSQSNHLSIIHEFSKKNNSNSCASAIKPIEKITEDERLKEMNFGDWEGLFWSDIPEEVTMPWMQDFVNIPTPNGENFVALATRANAFWQEITKTYSAKQQIVVTTHGGVIRSMISSLFEMELKNAFRFEISYGSITKISIRHGIPKVEYLNK